MAADESGDSTDAMQESFMAEAMGDPRQPASMTQYRQAAQRLMDCVDNNDEEGAQGVIDDLTHLRETELFKELGTLTRDLHEAIKAFQDDSRLADLTSNDIPDARERLNYVISMTEQAAHRTLNVLETSMPLCQELADESERLADEWARFRNRELSADDFRRLSRDIEAHLTSVRDNNRLINDKLADVMMAQDYQDLTGQIIRKVIALVGEVESNLVRLVRISGQRRGEDGARSELPQASPAEEVSRGEGPAMPGAEDTLSSQDDVDDLLSSLGF